MESLLQETAAWPLTPALDSWRTLQGKKAFIVTSLSHPAHPGFIHCVNVCVISVLKDLTFLIILDHLDPLTLSDPLYQY